MALSGLYIVTPDWDDTQKLVEVTEQALLGGAAIVQYRHKFADAALRHQQAGALQELCRRYQRSFIINDHASLCLELDADGVHVGGTDASVAEARRQVGSKRSSARPAWRFATGSVGPRHRCKLCRFRRLLSITSQDMRGDDAGRHRRVGQVGNPATECDNRRHHRR